MEYSTDSSFVPPERKWKQKAKTGNWTRVIFMYIYLLQTFSRWRCYINNRKMTAWYPKTSSTFIIFREYMSPGAILLIRCKSHSWRPGLYSQEATLCPCSLWGRALPTWVCLSNIQMWFHLLVGLLLATELTQIQTGWSSMDFIQQQINWCNMGQYCLLCKFFNDFIEVNTPKC